MLEVGFTELLLIGVVALIVMGPERLPGAARTIGLWLGKGRRMLRSVRDEIEEEIRADELKRVLEEQKKSTGLHEIVKDTSETLDDIKDQAESTVRDAAKTTSGASAEHDADRS